MLRHLRRRFHLDLNLWEVSTFWIQVQNRRLGQNLGEGSPLRTPIRGVHRIGKLNLAEEIRGPDGNVAAPNGVETTSGNGMNSKVAEDLTMLINIKVVIGKVGEEVIAQDVRLRRHHHLLLIGQGQLLGPLQQLRRSRVEKVHRLARWRMTSPSCP